jgi:hypothetical protein
MHPNDSSTLARGLDMKIECALAKEGRQLMKALRVFPLAIYVLIAWSPLSAHHGEAAYDNKNQVSLKGTVTEWFWANPHCILQFDIKDNKDQVLHWTGEASSPADMINHGWTKLALKPGDQVTVTLEPAKNGRPVGRIVEVVLPNGQKVTGGFLNQAAPNPGTTGGSKSDEYPKK